ncbi:MAG: DUF3990 domain-containing protein [Bacteroidales bacterium]|nr:DUF3990 domain-containing protein [Bacteroidales bacterium]
MKLYHGSTDIVEQPKIIKGDKFLDFGFGFYTTTNEEQALRWAKIKKKRTKNEKSYLNIYEMNDTVLFEKLFSVLQFDEPSREWLEFVIANRRGAITHNHDFVKGPVANDTLYRTFTLYESGVLTLQETINRLKVHELFDQLSFHTEKALANLKFVESEEIN